MASAIQDGGDADRNRRASRNGLERIQNRLPQPLGGPPPPQEARISVDRHATSTLGVPPYENWFALLRLAWLGWVWANLRAWHYAASHWGDRTFCG